MAKFTRLHHEVVAEILAKSRGASFETPNFVLDHIAEELRGIFSEDNERFDSEKFIEACQNGE